MTFHRVFMAMVGLTLFLAISPLAAVAEQPTSPVTIQIAQVEAPAYDWDRPNSNRYRGADQYVLIKHALAQSGWPAHVQAAVLANLDRCGYDVIPPNFKFEWMMFGDMRTGGAHVKRNVVAKTVLWPRSASRRTLVCRFEDRETMREYVFFIPEVCNNASGYSRPILVCECPPNVRVCVKR